MVGCIWVSGKAGDVDEAYEAVWEEEGGTSDEVTSEKMARGGREREEVVGRVKVAGITQTAGLTPRLLDRQLSKDAVQVRLLAFVPLGSGEPSPPLSSHDTLDPAQISNTV